MATQSNKRHLILFDGDNHRTEVFDDITQLSKIPRHCEFYIFCNETDPIRDKILDHLNDVTQVRVRRSSNPVSQKILDFIHTEIDKYSFLLIVCGPNPTYEQVFKTVWKKYGQQKLFVMRMKDPPDTTVIDILAQLRQHGIKGNAQPLKLNDSTQAFANYPCPQCSKSFYSNNELQEHGKNIHGSFSNKDLYMDSSANVSIHRKTNQDNKLIAESDFSCRICNEEFQSQGALKKHIEEEHPDVALD